MEVLYSALERILELTSNFWNQLDLDLTPSSATY